MVGRRHAPDRPTVGSETAAAYRAGYRDGWEAATEAARRLLQQISSGTNYVYMRMRRFWRLELRAWAERETDELMAPPWMKHN